MLAVGKVMKSIAIATLLGASLLSAGFVNDVSAQESVAVVIADDAIAIPVSYTHLTLPTTPYV